jgi:hypothetical protein
MRLCISLDIMFMGVLSVLMTGEAIDAAEKQPQAIKEAMPTAVGTTWRYRNYDAPRDEWDEVFSVLRIVDEQVVNGRRKWHTELVYEPSRASVLLLREIADKTGLAPPGGRAEPERYLNYYDVVKEAYIWLPVDAQDQPIAEPIARFPYPVKKGQQLHRREGAQSKVIDVKRKVKVEAGEFECIVVETREVNKETQEIQLDLDYYSAGVGLVRSELYALSSEKPKLLSKLDLIQFQQPKGQ